jgi:hypothetical protein
MIEKEDYFPKNLFDRYDGYAVWFRVMEEQTKQYNRD